MQLLVAHLTIVVFVVVPLQKQSIVDADEGCLLTGVPVMVWGIHAKSAGVSSCSAIARAIHKGAEDRGLEEAVACQSCPGLAGTASCQPVRTQASHPRWCRAAGASDCQLVLTSPFGAHPGQAINNPSLHTSANYALH